jgi:hypothetical protein
METNANHRRLKKDKTELLTTPATRRELEAQLLQSVERLDRDKGISGKEAFCRLHKRIKQSRRYF